MGFRTRGCRAVGVSTPSLSDVVPARATDNLLFDKIKYFHSNFALASACETEAPINQCLPYVKVSPILNKVSPIFNECQLPKPRFQGFGRNLGTPNILTKTCWCSLGICSGTLVQLESGPQNCHFAIRTLTDKH